MEQNLAAKHLGNTKPCICVLSRLEVNLATELALSWLKSLRAQK